MLYTSVKKAKTPQLSVQILLLKHRKYILSHRRKPLQEKSSLSGENISDYPHPSALQAQTTAK